MRRLFITLTSITFLFHLPALSAQETKTLFQIGMEDNKAGEFLYAPNGYKQFRNDGFYLVGVSDPKLDWPYTHPGPGDAWAGEHVHTFQIFFGLKNVQGSPCRLHVDLVDTHNLTPSVLEFRVNDHLVKTHQTPKGGLDDSILGTFEKGIEHCFSVEIPAKQLKAGLNTIAIRNAKGSWVIYDGLRFEAPGETTLQPLSEKLKQELVKRRPKPAPKLDKIVVVFKTHFDIGYSRLAKDVVEDYRTTMIDKALKLVEADRKQPRNEQFVWTIPGWPMSQILWEGQTPARRKAVERALKENHLTVHGFPCSTHTETLELEELVRGLRYGQNLARAYGLERPRDAKMTDVPCHTWLIPTLLKHAGIEFIHIGCNDASAPPKVPLLFNWEGPDGSRLMTMLTNTYGTWPYPPKGWKHKTWLALLHTGDNEGPPHPGHVQVVLNDYKKRLPGVEVVIGRMSDFYDAIAAEKPELPTVRGDMPDTWIYGPMSAPAGASTARHIRPQLPATEILHTQLSTWGIKQNDLHPQLAQAYEQSLLYGEHTWGLATQHYVKLLYGDAWKQKVAGGLDKNHLLLEASWEEHAEYIRRTKKLIHMEMQSKVSSLAKAVDVDGTRVVVYNPLPWKRSGLTGFDMGHQPLPGLRAVGSDRVEPVQVDGTSVRFMARDIPALGYRTYEPAEPKPQTEPLGCSFDKNKNSMESPFFKVVLDPAGGSIRSLVDKRSGKEWVDASAPHGFGQYLYERHSLAQSTAFMNAYVPRRYHRSHGDMHMKRGKLPANVPYRAAGPKNMTPRFKRDAHSVSVFANHEPSEDLPHKVALQIVLYQDLPVIDLMYTLEKPKETWPESGWICLPLKIDSPSYRLGRLGSIIDPMTDIIAGANHRLLWLNSGMAVFDPSKNGVGICPIDSPVVSLGEPGMLKYDAQYYPKRPWVYVNLFNNHWNTNFRSWWGGTWSSKVRLWAVEKYDNESGLITPGWEARLPLHASMANTGEKKLPPSRQGLSLSRKGILVTSFGIDPDWDKTTLRIWEHAGLSGTVVVTLPEEFKATSAQPIDLRGKPFGQPIPIKDRQFTTSLPAYAPASFRFP